MTLRAARGASWLGFALLLAGCATPETRLRVALVETGLSEPLAACMAGRMADRLSLAQLYRLRDLGQAGRSDSVDQFLHRVRSLRDSEILSVTAGSAAVCATGLAG
ncbi:hypothetical protein [Sphingosinicella sp. CPCC 101087]|uniref:hypothetical protein n=1 Tax=Sphingosinicella sp. CPCC 101087 TaxID=2497754 RepID=UPI00101BC764|nr:hypothetical protein [Sphingosinicella sp. CPCC 101087]